MSNMLRGHISCARGCCRSKPGSVESARAASKREEANEIAEQLRVHDDVHEETFRHATCEPGECTQAARKRA